MFLPKAKSLGALMCDVRSYLNIPQLLPMLGSKPKYVPRKCCCRSFLHSTRSISGVLYSRYTASTRSILRFCTTTSDTTAYTFGLALLRSSGWCCCRGYCLLCFKISGSVPRVLRVLYSSINSSISFVGSVRITSSACTRSIFRHTLNMPSIYFEYGVYFDRLCTVPTNSQARCSAQNTP